jgi:opacity protein-like surface antigen
MNRTTLLASAALLLLATPAFADGSGGKRLTGLGDAGYTYLDIDGGESIDNIHANGSALWTWPNKWNAQGNFVFDSFRDEPLGISAWKLGGAGFWRDQNEGMIGGEIHYQAIDALFSVDGVDLRGRGELFLPDITVGAHVGYSTYDDLDGWQLGAYGTYYANQHLGLRLGLDYGSWDADPVSPFNDFDTWSLDGEVEYLIPDCTTSIYAGLGFGSADPDVGPDSDFWRLGAGLRVHFGTDGSLMKRNREEPLRPIRTNFSF